MKEISLDKYYHIDKTLACTKLTVATVSNSCRHGKCILIILSLNDYIVTFSSFGFDPFGDV